MIENFLELIPSKSTREYLKKIGHVFTDNEQATIIYNLGLSFPKRDELLERIAQKTSDAVLREQIEERLAFDRAELKKFEDAAGAMFCIEGCFAKMDELYGPEEYGRFTTAALAKQVAMRSGKEFKIRKERLYSEAVSLEYAQMESDVAGVWYNAAGEVTSYWSVAEDECFKEREQNGKQGKTFEDRFIEIPHPFAYGDKVQVLGTEQLYTVGGFGSKEEEQKMLAAICARLGAESPEEIMDYLDVALYLGYENEDGKHDHTHVSPLFVEFTVKEKQN